MEYRIKGFLGSKKSRKGQKERFVVFFIEIGVCYLENGILCCTFAVLLKWKGD